MRDRTSIIEPKAGDLADKISADLKILLAVKEQKAETSQEPDADGDTNMVIYSPELSTMESQLRGVFHSALSLKFDLTMNMNRLLFFFFKPNVIYDAQSMGNSDPDAHPGEGARIKVCIAPAVYLAPERDSCPDEMIMDFDIRFNSYFLEATQEETESLELVSRAIVVV